MVRRHKISSRASFPRRAFTLLELLVVLMILGLLAGLSWPAVQRLLERSRVKEAAKHVRTELGEARLRAIESGRPQVFRFQPGTSAFEVRPKEEETAGPAVLKSALEQMSEEDDAEPVAGPERTDPGAYEKHLSGGMLFGGAQVAKEPAAGEEEEGLIGLSTAEMTERQNWSEPIIFYPNGRASNARIRVTDGAKYAIDVSLRGLTGTVRVGPTSRIEPAGEGETLVEGEPLDVEGLEEPLPESGTVRAGGTLGPAPVEAQP